MFKLFTNLYIIKFLTNFLWSNFKLANSFSHCSKINERSTSEKYVLRNKFQLGIHLVRDMKTFLTTNL